MNINLLELSDTALEIIGFLKKIETEKSSTAGKLMFALSMHATLNAYTELMNSAHQDSISSNDREALKTLELIFRQYEPRIVELNQEIHNRLHQTKNVNFISIPGTVGKPTLH